MQRRTFIKLVAANAAIMASPFAMALNDNRTWKQYNDKIIIDGLSTVFDTRSDTLTPQQLSTIRHSGITAVNATIPYPGMNYQETIERIEFTKKVIDRYPTVFKLITSTNDVLSAKENKQLGIILGFQSTEMFENDVDRIQYFAQQGVRYMQLTYNNQSQFGDGGLVKANKGLTSLGKQALLEMEKNNVLVDLSHSGQRTVAEAIEYSTKPLTISHTGCNAIFKHPRNNDDKELKAVADKGGVVGIYLMPFLEGGTGEITAESVMRHVDYAINLCGEDHVSIGSDQGVIPVNDGPEYREMIRKDVEQRIAKGISAPGETPNRPPFVPQLNSERRMELIAYYMNKRGYKDSVIEKIVGANLYNLFERVW